MVQQVVMWSITKMVTYILKDAVCSPSRLWPYLWGEDVQMLKLGDVLKLDGVKTRGWAKTRPHRME